MPLQARKRTGSKEFGPAEFSDVESLIARLRNDLAGEGYEFGLGPKTQEGFQRVYINRSGRVDQFDAFLDLRIGPESPGGPTIEMASGKPGTYGVPGFTRVVGDKNPTATTTTSTFKDFLRASYASAAEKNKPVQSRFWSIYQQGHGGYNLPASGAVLTPSSSSGQREFAARTVRYMVPEQERPDDFLKRVVKEANVGKIPGLEGYIPEVNQWNALVPGTSYVRMGATGTGGRDQWMGQTVRGVGSEYKSMSTVMEARNLASEPLVYEGDRLLKLRASSPTTGTGIRQGWTRSSVILPGESQTRNVLSKSVALADVADLSGAALMSPNALTVPTPGGGQRELYALGEQQNLATNLGITSVQQMEQMVDAGNMGFRDTFGKRVRSGKGSFEVGATYGAPITSGNIYDQLIAQIEEGKGKGGRLALAGKRYKVEGGVFREVRPITMGRKGYDIRAGRPVMFIPQYYNPASSEGAFSNVYQEGFQETTTLVENLQKRWKDLVDVRGYGVGGSGVDKDSPAEVQMTMPIVGINPPSIKTAGFKAEIHTMEDQLSIDLMGVGTQNIDFLTQEAKIPGRALMQSFGLMNRNTQLAFLKRFMPSTEGFGAVRKYINERYKTMGGNVALDLEEMAGLYGETAGEAPGYSADVMFANLWKSILGVKNPRTARMMYKTYGIGLPTNQSMATTTYSASEAQNMLEIARGANAPIEMEPIEGGRYRMKQRVVQGQAAVIQAGLSFTPEYQSQSQYIGPKAIMSLIENYPEAARSMGLTGPFHIKEGGEVREGFTGPLSGNPSESRKGWVDMWSWLSYQKDLNEYVPSIPKDTVELTPALASEIQSALNVAALEPNSEARVKRLTGELHNIDVTRHNLATSVDLADSFFVDPSTATLIPKLSSIAAVESYKEGVQEGQTRTYISDQYFRLLQATAMSSMSTQDKAYAAVADARNRFYSRMANEFMPPESGFRGKEIYRNILGVDLPGTRGGRYAGMTGLEAGESYADDDYIRKMLSNGNMYNQSEINSIMRYLNSHQDAYLPMLAQRFPDISGKFTFMPMKLRSKKFLEQRGIKVPDNAATRGTFFMTQTANRFFVGDFDADPAMQKVLPITNRNPLHPEESTDTWHLADQALQEEFDQQFAIYKEGNDAVDRALAGMFGARGMDRSSESLDAARKNMADYMEAVIAGHDGSYKGSLAKRVSAVGEVTLQELMAAGMKVKGFKGGMGVAYNRRTMTEDIMDAVLNATGNNPAHEEVRGKAYESGAMMYQLYLDRQKSVEGGYSPLETMLNSINIGGIGSDFGDAKYRVTYRLSDQGSEHQFAPDEGWTNSIYQQGFADTGNMFRSFMDTLSRTPQDMLSNAMLAWGFGARGRASEVYEALEQADPTKPKSRYYALQDMMKKGAVGLASPFYMATLYNMISRLETKNPAAFEDPSIRLPWINGEVMSVKNIAATKEFRSARALQNLFVSGKGVIGASEIEELTQLGGSRMAIHALGVYNAWQQSTHGLAGAEEVQQKLGSQFENIARNVSRSVMQSAPIIHASELGALGGKDITGWTPHSERYAANALYGVLARWMGIPEVFGDRDYGGNVLFKKVDYGYIDEDIAEQSHIEQGNAFEKVFAKANEGSLHHIGQVQRESGDWSPINRGNLTYSVNTSSGPVTITGIPDFVDYDEKQDKLVIRDTKLARSDPRLNPDVARRVKSYKNRIQQIAYAYGLEKLASDSDEDAWIEQMRHWKFDPTVDRQKLLRMRSAAASGRFSISLQPGYVDRQTGLQTYSPIDIEYGDNERQELENLAEGIASTTFNDRMVSYAAKELNRVIKTPGAMPRGLVGMTRTGVNADLKKYGVLEELARIPTARAAGGGAMDDSEKTIRVGEGGPEDIKIGKKGIEIVPTDKTPEARLARGQNDPVGGYLGSRHAGGIVMNTFPGMEDEPSGQATPQGDPRDFSREQQQAAQMLGQVAPAPLAGFDYKAFSDALAAALRGAVKVQLDFGKTAPANMVEQTRALRTALDQLGGFTRNMSGYESGMRETLTGAFRDAGAEDLISENMGVADLLTVANQNLAPGQYLPRLKGLMGQSKDMARMAGSYQKLSRLIGGKAGENLLQYVPEEMQEQIARFRSMSDSAGLEFPQVEQVAGAASIMNAMSQQQSVKGWLKDSMTGQSADLLEKWAGSLGKLVESSDKLVNTQGNQIKMHESYTAVLKESYQLEINKKEIARQQAKETAGDLFGADGKLIGAREMAARVQQGRVSPEQLAAVEEYATTGREISSLKDKMSDEVESRGMGGFFRKAFGGFGLMYMRSIAGLIGTGSYTGYGERLQMEQAMAAPFMGMGGQLPYNVQDRLRTIQAVQYGGQGGILMQNAVANIMQNNPALYNSAMSGVAGLSAFGMASWLLPEFGLKGRTGLMGALGVGALVQTASQQLNIAGAQSDVMGTATALAARQQSGAQASSVGNLGMALGYGAMGAASGLPAGPAGAVIGGGIGLLYGAWNWYNADVQQRAAERSPEIQRQTEVLSALANAGDRGIAASRVFERYGIQPSQQAAYMQQAAMVRANELGGLPDQAKAAGFAYSLKTNQPMSIEQMRQYGNMAVAGYDIEKLGQNAMLMSGVGMGLMNTGIFAPEAPRTLMGAVNAQYGVGSQIPGQAAPTRMVASGTWGSAYTMTMMGQLSGNPFLTEQVGAGMEFASGLGIASQWDATRKATPEEQAREDVTRYSAYGQMKGTAWGDIYKARMLDYYQRQSLGMQTGARPSYQQYAQQALTGPTLTPQQYQAQQDEIGRDSMLTNTGTQIRSIWTGALGISSGQADNLMAGVTNQAVATFQSQQAQFAQQFQANLVGGGLGGAEAQKIAANVAQMGGPQFNQFKDMASFKPLAIADWAMRSGNTNLLNMLTLNGYGGQVPITNMMMTDVNAQGQLTGLPWGTTSLAMPGISAQTMAGRIWGQNWQGNAAYGAFGQSAINTMVNGIAAPWGGQLQGMQAMKLFQLNLSHQYAQQQAGNQMAQLDLAMAFQTGVGLNKYAGTVNPQTGQPFGINTGGGGLWGVEDRMRDLSRQQQEYQFRTTERDINMQDRYFRQNFGLNRTQTTMQRGWQMEDWAFQDQTRNLQWGWKVQDFQENVRFMSGRERRLAERQMGRETIMHNLEGDQIDKQRDRQKELWKLEDQRFDLQKKQHQESTQNAREDLAQARKFYEENKKLQDEQTKLNRAYWVEQQKLAREAAAASAAYAEKQYQLQLVMLALETYTQNAQGSLNRLNDVSMTEFIKLIDELDPKLSSLIKNAVAAGGGNTNTGGGSGSAGNAGGGGGGGGYCFTGDTPVCTPDGDIPIRNLRMGAAVLVKSSHNSVDEAQVGAVVISERNDLLKLTFSNGYAIKCSPNHRFLTERGWREAASLTVGDQMVALADDVTLQRVELYPGWHTVFNLRIEHPEHTYLVGGIVVHNTKAEMRALGGPALAGQTYQVEEREAEFFRPNLTGEILPLSKLRDPWAATMLTPGVPAAPSQPATVNIFIGNERLASFVIDAVDKEINL